MQCHFFLSIGDGFVCKNCFYDANLPTNINNKCYTLFLLYEPIDLFELHNNGSRLSTSSFSRLVKQGVFYKALFCEADKGEKIASSVHRSMAKLKILVFLKRETFKNQEKNP
jgi:hypothetical protein